MPLYKMTINSRSVKTIHMSRTFRTRSARDVIKRAKHMSASLIIGNGLPDDDIEWAVFRQSGHLDGWEIVSHNRNRNTSNNA